MDELEVAIEAVTRDLSEARRALSDREQAAFGTRRAVAKEELERALTFAKVKAAQAKELEEQVEKLSAANAALELEISAVR